MDVRAPALVGGGGAGYLDGPMPSAAHLAHDEHLIVAGLVGVVPASAAVARRRARHRLDLRAPALIEGGSAGHLLRGVPGPSGGSLGSSRHLRRGRRQTGSANY